MRIFAPAIVLAVAGFLVAYQFVDPAPPQRFTIATAGADGAYHAFAMRYRSVLARQGVELELLQTAGSVENLRRLRAADGRVQVAFVQGGVGTPAEGDALESLASLYFEPLWVFHRDAVALERLTDLRGGRVAVGAPGSGTRAIAVQLLADNGVTPDNTELLPAGGVAAAQALIAGALDAVFIVGTVPAPAIQTLLRAPAIRLLSFARAEAYTRLRPELSSVRLPRGVIDLAADLPAHDITLLAPAATLVAHRDFHPALVDLLMRAAAEVHRDGGLFEDYGQFPSPRYVEFPLSDEAQRYFESGPSFLRRVLPFWAATLVERMLVMLLPLLALLIPLVRIMPPVYRWRIRSRIYRWYRELLAIDPVVRGAGGDPRQQAGIAELDRIEQEIAKVHVPLSYADQLYALRVHLELVREKLDAARARGGPDAP